MFRRVCFYLCTLVVLLPALQGTTVFAAESEALSDPHPLRPVDISSPHDTLRSFNSSVDEAARAWRSGESRKAVRRAESRAMEALDFSRLPERRFADRIEGILQLREILDRIELPPDEEIPGDTEVEDENLTAWTIPDTEITIAKVEEGPRAGKFLFTAESVERLEEFYERAKHLPYKEGALAGVYDELMFDIGLYAPRSLRNVLPAWSKTRVLGEVLWKWPAFAVIALAVFFIVRGLLRWGHQWDDRHRDARAFLRFGAPLSVLASVLVLRAAIFLFRHVLGLLNDLWDPIIFLLNLSIFVGLGWLLLLLAGRITDTVNEVRRIKEGSIDSQLVRIVFQLLGFIAVIVLVIYAADVFGVPLTPVLASLGLGGLAVALAVRPTLENVMGGLILFADKPVRVGNYCSIGNWIGTVEEIGLRSTRVRGLDRTLISIPNAKFADMEIVNWAECDTMLIGATIGLRFETTPDQLRYALVKMREMCHAHPKIESRTVRVRYIGPGASSRDVSIRIHALTNDWNDFYAIREDVFLRIDDIVEEAGTGYAFPSRTLYMGEDDGLDAKRQATVVEEVKSWRRTGKLPFPRISASRMDELEGSLDYPPRGSVEAPSQAPETPERLSTDSDVEQPSVEQPSKERE